MKVEVYKLYDDNIKMFNTVSTPSLTYKSKHFPPDGKFNSNGVDEDGITIANKFDSKGSEYDFGSTLRNVVIDYAPPEFVKDYSKYTSFREKNGLAQFNIKFEVSDNLGIDCEKFQIGFFYGTEDEQVLFESKHTFSEDDVPEGDLNEESQFNDSYDGPLAEVIDTMGPDFVDTSADWYIYHKGRAENYVVDFNINVNGTSDDEGTAIGLLYKDLDEGVYQKYEEMNAGALYVKLWDLAGNEYVFTGFKPLMIIPWTYEEFIGMFDPLSLYFYDTYPANMFLQENVIGQSKILVENTNKVLSKKYGFETVLKLEQDSPGYLVDWSKKVEDYDLYQDVDGIDTVGYVKAFAYLFTDKFDKATFNLIREATMTKGSLGPWVKECEDNTRKINVDPFVPEFAKDTTFYHFCKFIENYLNTAWCPLDKDCRIGLLEKIERIGDFNDIDLVEFPAVQFWAEDRGNELQFDKAAIDAIKGMSKKYNLLDMDSYECIRYLYKNLPAINMYKGTIDCFKLIFNSLGINAELIPLWGRNVGEGNEDWQPEYFYDRDKNDPKAWNKKLNDLYYLSSHIELKVHGYLAYDLVDIAASIVKLARSVLPVVRVIEYLLIEEFSQSSNYLSLGYYNQSKELDDDNNLLQCITFMWETQFCDFNTISPVELELRIPQIAGRSSTAGANWWKGWSGKTGDVVDGNTIDGIRISNKPTLNASKFFNMMKETLKNHKVYIYLDYAKYSGWTENIPMDGWYNTVTPVGVNKIDPIDIKWDAGYFVIKAKPNSLDALAQLTNARYLIMTFVFNRNTGLCYTTDLRTAITQTPTVGSTLIGFKPYEWPKFKKEKI